ncbi:hypothetical protein A5766_10520 [Gordonia sp. 852002-51296_SCH5728562-b]|nr:hypothetical protein A5766_10520 [Gordonia sp. 852002-51296_SCH5728562-b]
MPGGGEFPQCHGEDVRLDDLNLLVVVLFGQPCFEFRVQHGVLAGEGFHNGLFRIQSASRCCARPPEWMSDRKM